MKKVLLTLILMLSFASFSQNINDYQYVIVPKKFDSFKEEDKHGLNTSVKLLLQKYGFKAYFSDDSFFDGNVGNRCDFLTAGLVDDSGLMVTKVRVVLKDCKGNIVYQTELGRSREKQYSIAYSQALREAAKSFETLNYKYNGNIAVAAAAEPKPVVKVIDTKTDTATVNSNEVFFFAQPTANGYQVIDNEPKVIMRLYNTSQKNVFMADKNGVNGTVLIKEGQWVFEYYDNGKLVSEPINLKF
ncbi:hypothetical protein HKT18_09550 [Flavobacterium sp. IMCC34852]|uniref:Uncharacterized protein n=1 Tax=Flavobacterium rivulicola TaxID=2732161 RepID=A0A7Y3R9N6_9FLAO|nr:hypothetical protein [Flavobacterium sp. IMCC34852]NNT72458.1 hypothetical protein [Flavobacterium sp. IMCC34852]